MTYPECGSDRVHRSKRRGWERLLTPLPIPAYRCHKCEHRFRAYSGGEFEDLSKAHCARCRDSQLSRTPRHTVHRGMFRLFWRALGIPAYYCPRCRYHFSDAFWLFHRGWARELAAQGKEDETSHVERAT